MTRRIEGRGITAFQNAIEQQTKGYVRLDRGLKKTEETENTVLRTYGTGMGKVRCWFQRKARRISEAKAVKEHLLAKLKEQNGEDYVKELVKTKSFLNEENADFKKRLKMADLKIVLESAGGLIKKTLTSDKVKKPNNRILQNRKANKDFIYNHDYGIYLGKKDPDYDDQGWSIRSSRCSAIEKILERMGQGGQRKLTEKDLEKVIEEEFVQYQCMRKCLEEVNENYLKKVYQSLPSESRLIPESNLPLDRLGKTIRNNIKEHHGSGLEVTLPLVEDLTKSILMAYVKTENEKALLAQNMEDPKKDLSTRKNEVTIENLVRFSWEK